MSHPLTRSLDRFMLRNEDEDAANAETPQSYLKGLSLGITSSVTRRAGDIDLKQTQLKRALRIAVRSADIHGLKIYRLYGTHWAPVRPLWCLLTLRNMSSPVELAIVDRNQTILSRLSLHLWQKYGNHWRSRSNDAPVKRARLPWRAPGEGTAFDYVSFPIDAVYTWVNSKDAEWRAMYSQHGEIANIDKDRFEQNDELKYSLRSVELFAPWFRRIFIFTNCAPPKWFKSTDRIIWINHTEVIHENDLPTFNSHAIETYLHEIPDLVENFVYLNDDFLISSPLTPEEFFTPQGQSLARLEPHGLLPFLKQLEDDAETEEWQHAAINGAMLMTQRFGKYPTRLHEHAPYALCRSTFRKVVEEFSEEIARTRASRFRSAKDLSIASFLYHHFAILSGKALKYHDRATMIRPSNYRHWAWRRRRAKFICVNDGGGSSADQGYRRFKQKYLARRYPFKCSCEI